MPSLRDIIHSEKVAAVLSRHTLSVLAGALLEMAIFTLLGAVGLSILVSVTIARVCAALTTFFLAREVVFRSERSLWHQAAKYFALVAMNILILWPLLEFFISILGFSRFSAIVMASCLLFALNFIVQKALIFSK